MTNSILSGRQIESYSKIIAVLFAMLLFFASTTNAQESDSSSDRGQGPSCEAERTILVANEPNWGAKPLPASLLLECFARTVAEHHKRRIEMGTTRHQPNSIDRFRFELEVNSRLGIALGRAGSKVQERDALREAFNAGRRLINKAGGWSYMDRDHKLRDLYLETVYRWGWDARIAGFADDANEVLAEMERIAGFYRHEDFEAFDDGTSHEKATLALRLARIHNLAIHIYRWSSPNKSKAASAEEEALLYIDHALRLAPEPTVEMLSFKSVILSNLDAQEITVKGGEKKHPDLVRCELIEEIRDAARGQFDRRVVVSQVDCAIALINYPESLQQFSGHDEFIQKAHEDAVTALEIDPFGDSLRLRHIVLELMIAWDSRNKAETEWVDRGNEKLDENWNNMTRTDESWEYCDKDNLVFGKKCAEFLTSARDHFSRLIARSAQRPIEDWNKFLFIDAAWSENEGLNAQARTFQTEFLVNAHKAALASLEVFPRAEGPLSIVHDLATYLESQLGRDADHNSLDIVDSALDVVAKGYETDAGFADRHFMNEACRMHGTYVRRISYAYDRDDDDDSWDPKLLRAAKRAQEYCQPFADSASYAIYTRNSLASTYRRLLGGGPQEPSLAEYQVVRPYFEWLSQAGERSATRYLLEKGRAFLDESDRRELELRIERQSHNYDFEFSSGGRNDSWLFRASETGSCKEENCSNNFWKASAWLDARKEYDRPVGPSAARNFLLEIENKANELQAPMPQLALSIEQESEFVHGEHSSLEDRYQSYLELLNPPLSDDAPPLVWTDERGVAFDGYLLSSIAEGDPIRSDAGVYALKSGAAVSITGDELESVHDNWPMFNGWDPVALAKGKWLPGKPEHHAALGTYESVGRKYVLFASAENKNVWENFRTADDGYENDLLTDAADHWRDRQPEFSHHVAWEASLLGLASALSAFLVFDSDDDRQTIEDEMLEIALQDADNQGATVSDQFLTALERLVPNERRVPQDEDGNAFSGRNLAEFGFGTTAPNEEGTTFYRGAFVNVGANASDDIAKYWPEFNGWDPVELADGNFVAGDPAIKADNYLGFKGIYAFQSDANRSRWQADDGTLYNAARVTWINELPKFEIDLPEDDSRILDAAPILGELRMQLPGEASAGISGKLIATLLDADEFNSFDTKAQQVDAIAEYWQKGSKQSAAGKDRFAFGGKSLASILDGEPVDGDRDNPVYFRGALVALGDGESERDLSRNWPLFGGWDPIELAGGRFVAGTPSHALLESESEFVHRAILFSSGENLAAVQSRNNTLSYAELTAAAKTYVSGNERENVETAMEPVLDYWFEAYHTQIVERLSAGGVIKYRFDQPTGFEPALEEATERGNFELLRPIFEQILAEVQFSNRRTPINTDRIAFEGYTISSVASGNPIRPSESQRHYYRDAFVEAEGNHSLSALKKLWPRFNGWDPVALSQGRFVAGSVHHHFADPETGTYFLFADEANREQFALDPSSLVGQANGVWRTQRPEFARDLGEEEDVEIF